MSRGTAIETGTPVDDLVAAVWRGLLDDLQLHGYVNGDLPTGTKKQNFPEAARIRRREYQEDARVYLDSNDFKLWATMCSLDPDDLRRKLIDAADC